uniref:Uncharacterized protein n=1 Tax=Trieres chinensis TaxID=1514140 RepID=A0A7S1ZZG1_TRICV
MTTTTPASRPRPVRWVLFFLLASLALSHPRAGAICKAQEAEDARAFIPAPLRQKFDELPPKGKFATGAFVGFAATRMAIRTAVKVVKFAGAVFVVSEAMNVAGVFDNIDLPDVIEENGEELLKKARRRVVGTVNDFRMEVRQRLKPEKVRSVIEGALEKERMATLGVATGAFAGLIL